MKMVVDKIEEGIATVELENGEILNVSSKFIDGAKEGDIVEVTVNKKETIKRKKKIEDFVNKLFEN